MDAATRAKEDQNYIKELKGRGLSRCTERLALIDLIADAARDLGIAAEGWQESFACSLEANPEMPASDPAVGLVKYERAKLAFADAIERTQKFLDDERSQ